jgi:PAS domain S-box-containing protein
MLVAIIILALYFWAYFADVKSISAALLVDDKAAIMAGVALAIGFVSYLWAPKKLIFWGSLAAYIVLCATSATLILSTGGVSSPFVALWIVISVFAGVFGQYGLLPMVMATIAYLLFLYTGNNISPETVFTVVLVGDLPLAASYLIWHTKSKGENSSDQAYNELATELSQVAGKSEVVINAIADGVIALNGQGIIQLINPAAQQIIGWGKQDALSLDYKSVLKLLDKNDHELTPANDPVLLVLANNKEVSTNNLSLLTNSGKKLLVSVIVSPVGQLGAGVIIVFRDITSEKSEERQQAEFISTAAHEMRTPVASIEGYLGLALNPATAQVDEKARDFINKAHESAQHLGRLFQDLLDVSKADDSRLSDNPKVVDVVMFAHDIAQGLRSKANDKGLRFVYKPMPDDENEKAGERRLNPVFYANVDNDHLREIISNLIENAIKYTPKGDVTVDVGGDNEHVVISVADSGIGIPKEDQSHLFQKFYRIDNSETREIGGTGLGLYLCRRLAEAMNGRIWLDSEYKRGSTFYLEIPRIDHEEATRLIEAASVQQEAQEPQIIKTAYQAPMAEPPTPALEQPSYAQPTPQSSDSVYTNQPVETVVQQLKTVAAISSAPQQYAAPAPQQYAAPAAPQYQAPVQQPAPVAYAQQPQYTQYAPTQQTRPNVPLTSIEQNPNQYMRTRTDGVPVPPRNQN